jgi:hypothetical protein
LYGNGRVYEGEFENGKENGYGKYYWRDGGIYIGEFKNGIINQNGIYFERNGEIFDKTITNRKR